MVQVEIAQLTGECETWRDTLRQYREEFTQDKQKLQQAVSQPLSKEQLQDVEHLHNQFHIQLINIHDLKQSIKAHERKMNFEREANGTVGEGQLGEHEQLLEEFNALESTLGELRNEFSRFLHTVS